MGGRIRLFFFALFILLLPGCFSPVSKEMRRDARKDLSFPAVQRNPDAYLGSTVIWGGIVIWTQNRGVAAEITVLETPLQYPEMPRTAHESRGRFLARISNVSDPAIYDQGTRITIGGVITGFEKKPLGAAQYAYPVLDVRELHVWRRDLNRAYPFDYFWVDPFHPLPPPFWIYGPDP
jgi:outer membrane lipoprotein